MMRVTPLRLITLQCSQMGLTLLRTFTKSSDLRANIPVRRAGTEFSGLAL
jgi:hypothetical protein